MKKFLLPSLITSLLLGCSSNNPSVNIEQYSHYSGGQSMGDATSLFWYTEKLTAPYSASDYVTAGDYGWYQTSYRWEDDQVRELIREGERRDDASELIPYRIHVRFNKAGEAIYQQYRRDGRVLPVKTETLTQLLSEAQVVVQQSKEQRKQGLRLIQGYWDGSSFETCSGQNYAKIEFNHSLPNFVVNRLADVDSYVAFLGSGRNNKVVVEELLMLANDDHHCIERPELLEE